MADDDVLLQALQIIPGTPHRSIRENPRGLLEGCRRDERLRRQAGLGDTQKQGFGASCLPTALDDGLVHLSECYPIDVVTLQELSVSWIRDPNLLKHLANDDTDVLVIDLHALEAVHLLDLVQQVLLDGTWTFDPQDIVRINGAFTEAVPSSDMVAFMDPEVLPDRDLVNPGIAALRLHDDLTLTSLDLTEGNQPVHLRDDRRIFRPTGLVAFKEFDVKKLIEPKGK